MEIHQLLFATGSSFYFDFFFSASSGFVDSWNVCKYAFCFFSSFPFYEAAGQQKESSLSSLKSIFIYIRWEWLFAFFLRSTLFSCASRFHHIFSSSFASCAAAHQISSELYPIHSLLLIKQMENITVAYRNINNYYYWNALTQGLVVLGCLAVQDRRVLL